MTLSELHACLNRLGIVLSACGDRLRYQAPPGAMTPDLKVAVAEHRSALLVLLVESPVDAPGQAVANLSTRLEKLEKLENPPDDADLAATPWPPRPVELARWPVEWRAKWGVRANELQDQGVPWPEHERRAFDMVRAEREASP
jgi:hypothetical protein